MKCRRCQHENEAGAKFCEECAAPLARACAKCGRQLSPTAKFCPECANATGLPAAPPPAQRFDCPESYTPKHLAEKILTSKAALEGERKQVTVLFADLKGSMELLADRDPEEARKLLDPVLKHMMEAIHRYEGTVNQVMGDGIMALFGAPLAHEDHAVRACYAALRMQESVKRYADGVFRSHGVAVQIRVGLNSGEVVVRAIGSDLHMDYTAVGQTTHLAARMEQLATPGTIRLTPATLALAEGYVEVTSLGPVPIKGLADPVEVYEVTGAGSARTRLQARARRGLTRFVGRDAELGHLRRAQQQASSGQGQVAAIVGEAGVGKSRLGHEFVHSHRLQGWLVLEGASVSYGKATSYLPVIELLKRYFKVQERDDLREIREKVTGKLLTLDRALEPTLPALLGLFDVLVDDAAWLALDPPTRRQRTLDGVKRLLLREAREQALLLIFEDLHWIDGETQALLDGLVDGLSSTRLMLLVNYRPEYRHAWASKTCYSQIRLETLPAESTGELLESLLGDDPGLAPLKQLLGKRGNPFFLEETVQTLVETKALTGTRGRYHLSGTLQGLQVPPTVQAMLAARIDRLPPEDKRLLQTASVLGKDVPFGLLKAIAELPDEALRRGLDHLQAAEFLYETDLFPDLKYTFKHALTHDVTYASLLHDRRRLLHRALVEAMEHHYAGRLTEHAERLAYHAVRGEAWEKAVTHLWQAGRNARHRSTFRESMAFLEQVVETLRRLPETVEHATVGIDIRCHDITDALTQMGQHDRLLEYLEEARSLAESIGDRARLAEVLARTVAPLRRVGRYEQAIETGERAYTIAGEVGDARLKAIAGMELGWQHMRAGNFQRAEALFNQVVAELDSSAASRGLPDQEWMRRFSLEGLVETLTFLGRYGEAVDLGEEAVRMAHDLGHAAPIAATLFRLGRAHASLGNVTTAIDLGNRSLTISRERNVLSTLQYALACLGMSYTLAGRSEEAVARLEEAVAAGESQKNLDAFTVAMLGHAYLSAGRQDDAHRSAHHALSMSRKTRPSIEAIALHLLGEIATRRSPSAIDVAAQHFRTALALATTLGMRPLAAHCHLSLGKLYRLTGKQDQAQQNLTTATTMYREMDMTYWLEQAEVEMQTPDTS